MILGASGLVGKAIAKECLTSFDVYGTYFSSGTNLVADKQFQLNMQKEETIREILDGVQPDIIVSSLQGDYDDQLKFHQTLVEELENRNCVLYYFSTTNVFDGDLTRHHTESDTPLSKSDYGRYKINCEKMLMQSLGKRCAIIRIPGIWGKNSPRFNSIKKHLETAAPIQAYPNLECNFLLDTQLARQVRFIVENELRGIFHLAAVDMVKEYAFYDAVVQKLTPGGIPIQSTSYQDKETTYYFGLVSTREDLPDSLQITNEEIISYLVE